VGADVEDDTVGLDGARRVHCLAQRRHRLLVELVVRAGEIAEVDRVDEDGLDAGLLCALREARQDLRIVFRKAPGPRALDEQLNRVRADRPRSLRSGLHAAGKVAAQEHGPTIVT
jgi:hypothetical protein